MSICLVFFRNIILLCIILAGVKFRCYLEKLNARMKHLLYPGETIKLSFYKTVILQDVLYFRIFGREILGPSWPGSAWNVWKFWSRR